MVVKRFRKLSDELLNGHDEKKKKKKKREEKRKEKRKKKKEKKRKLKETRKKKKESELTRHNSIRGSMYFFYISKFCFSALSCSFPTYFQSVPTLAAKLLPCSCLPLLFLRSLSRFPPLRSLFISGSRFTDAAWRITKHLALRHAWMRLTFRLLSFDFLWALNNQADTRGICRGVEDHFLRSHTVPSYYPLPFGRHLLLSCRVQDNQARTRGSCRGVVDSTPLLSIPSIVFFFLCHLAVHLC